MTKHANKPSCGLLNAAELWGIYVNLFPRRKLAIQINLNISGIHFSFYFINKYDKFMESTRNNYFLVLLAAV